MVPIRLALHLLPIVLIAGACSNSDASGTRAAQRGVALTGRNLGVNVGTIDYWGATRPFRNLIYGSGWQMRDAAGQTTDVPRSALDPNGWIKFLPKGARAIRILSVPAKSADMVCRWVGNDHGSMTVIGSNGARISDRRQDAGELRFRYVSIYPGELAPVHLQFDVDPADHVRDIDCREASAAADESFEPLFQAALNGFALIRFMKWQSAVETNAPVTWATRNKPGDGDFLGNDGVPVELMIELANQSQADPWFTIPWNADDDYVARFATMVRDKLPPGRRAYVELSNEVWNGSYAVMHQAEREGASEKLDSRNGVYGQAMYRYAEKTQHVMEIWSKVFTGQDKRLVRVVSAQHVSPFWAGEILGYRHTAKYVDALATAPYWALDDEDDKGQSLDHYMDTLLPARIGETLDWAVQQKAIAAKYGKRYIAYEGGQHVWLNNNAPLVARIERDPRMYGLYRTYIGEWNKQIGDSLTLFALAGGIGKAGFGLVEYIGQPVAQAPKMRAAQSFMSPQPSR